MATYTYSGLHPRDGTIPVHTFYSCDGGKPVVAMKSSIVIDGQSLQRTNIKEAIFMLNAFQHFKVSDIYTTDQDYDYAFLVENLENDSIPDKLIDCAVTPASTYIGIIIDYDQEDDTYTVGCGMRIFTNVISEFSCTNPMSEFPSVMIQTRSTFNRCENICDFMADITCMMDCLSKDLSPASSCSALHDLGQCTPGAAAAAAVPLDQIDASSTESLECAGPYRFTTEECSASSACSLREKPLKREKTYSFRLEPSDQSDNSGKNKSPKQGGSNADTFMSYDEFEALKPTVSAFEKRNKGLFDDKLTVTVSNKPTSKD